MTLRRLFSALFASILFAGLAASAHAAPAKPRTVHHRTMTHATTHATRASSTGRRAAVRGGDAQNSAVDQLNSQSLQRAQTGQ